LRPVRYIQAQRFATVNNFLQIFHSGMFRSSFEQASRQNRTRCSVVPSAFAVGTQRIGFGSSFEGLSLWL
jgi:hypothetical protein